MHAHYASGNPFLTVPFVIGLPIWRGGHMGLSAGAAHAQCPLVTGARLD